MSSPFQTQKFKKLKEAWYSKLTDSGFEDIEVDEDKLKRWDVSIFARNKTQNIFSKMEYFRLAGHFLEDKEFESEKDRIIWDLHSQGLSYNEISRAMKADGHPTVSRSSINLVILKLAKEMLKKYEPTNR